MTSWMVLQKPGSGYRDVEGKCYEYPAHIPHAKKISEGDYLICTRPKNSIKTDKRIFGIGRISSIDEYERDGRTMFNANYGWYRDLPEGFSFKDFGGDPRVRPGTQHSMSPISTDIEEELLSVLMGDFADDLEVITQEERMNRDVSPSPVSIQATKSASKPSKFGQWLEAKMEVKELTAPILARSAGCHPATIRNIISGKIRTPSDEMMEKLSNIIEDTIPQDVQQELDEGRVFAREQHLQDYLVQNLEDIEEGLTLFEDGINSGVEYPAGRRRIDVLALDGNGDLVVIELKVNRAYDRVLGQIQHYMGWVRNNIARDSQNVRGIIIASDISNDLRIACSLPSNPVSLREYSLSFSLREVS
ncbi:MAG: endonuclease NucS domain-containing protein [Candidatus Thermoplasmatota archaeon]|nr:endonuclease NucS domain-containing protein [Candidatus Thermoplasmatota archaeon]